MEISLLRRALWFHITVIVSIGLLSILLNSLHFNSPSPWKEGREHLLDELDELTLQGWMLHDKSLYLVSTTKKGWRASREDCQKRKADLVVINSREELNQVSRFDSRLMGSSWIGLSDQEKEGTLKWVDGTPMTSSWRHVKPRDDGGARDCVVAGEDGWSEEPCNRLHHWICEKVLDLDHLEAERNKEGSVMPTEEEEEEAPNITEFHSSTHVLPVGQTARYTCHAGGTPEPTVEWLYNGRPLERDGTDDQSEAWVERGFLFIRGGRYGVNTVCCMASNSAGTANHCAELLVFDACDLTLDPNTAHRRLSLSEDTRKVTGVGEDQSYPDHPDRFDSRLQVLGREALTGRCYWEVKWGGGVEIGVTYRGITRRGRGGDSRLGENNKSWVLYCYDGGYFAWYNGIETALPLRPAGSTRVGVYLDRPAGSLSFYRVSPGGGGSSDTLTHLHTFRSSFTQEDLLPGVGVWSGEGSTASLCRL
uniref:B30.2/SPRY domain-containing protein n=1 Tax=Gadus morhua TaxID=8049 RepID=A0A8C5AW72_GADMO